MKKTILFALPVIFVIIFMAFSLTNSSAKPQDATVTFQIVGCDDCKNVRICLDGVIQGTPINACKFNLTLPKGHHTLCIICGGGDVGSLFEFDVTNDPIQSFTVNLLTLPTNCNCKK